MRLLILAGTRSHVVAIPRAAALALAAAALAAGGAARAAEGCDELFAVFDGRGTTFDALKGAYLTDEEQWVPTVSLPGAECRIDTDGEKGRYTCSWRIRGGTEQDARRQIVAMSVASRDCLVERGVRYDLWTPGGGRMIALLHERKLGVGIVTSIFTVRGGYVAEWRMTTWKNTIDWDNIPDPEWNFPTTPAK